MTSGIRVGTPAMTTRGFKKEEARLTAELAAEMLNIHYVDNHAHKRHYPTYAISGAL